jgi:hypothetical protein
MNQQVIFNAAFSYPFPYGLEHRFLECISKADGVA